MAYKLSNNCYGRDLRELNRIGDRVKWCRITLNLSQKNVCDVTEIPRSTYVGRENGVRSIFPEEFVVLSDFFNEEWIKKFGRNGHYPEFEGNIIKHVDFKWLLVGIYDQQREGI